MRINVLDYFSKTVDLSPDKTAIIDGQRKITFRDLDKKAKSIAHQIVCLSNTVSNPIAVYLPKSINSVVADIAITYTGNAYMNLDVKSPLSRTKSILDLVKPLYIITDTGGNSQLENIYPPDSVINMDKDFYLTGLTNEELLINRLSRIIDTDPLCIINTSGSTGTPKGVVLNHKSFIDFTEWAIDTLKISDKEVVGSLSPLVFDIYSFELCMLMCKGSTIVLLPDSLAAFPAKILALMKETAVTFIFWVPTIMVNLANMDLLSKFDMPSLKMVWFAGEVFPTKQFNYWRKHLPTTKFVNLYGPIEITLDCTYYIADRELKDEEPIPIGFPCRNTDILILNADNQVATGMEEGELCVRGTSLAMGYYNNPEKTSAAFVQNPLNKSYPELIYRTGDIASLNERGEIIFKGRKDTLVKHLGYRIELGEIEHIIINKLKLVENGCVVYNFVKKEITLFYQAQNEIPVAEIKKQISLELPRYMVPVTYIKMDELPRNANGKIDRLQLNKKVTTNE